MANKTKTAKRRSMIGDKERKLKKKLPVSNGPPPPPPPKQEDPKGGGPQFNFFLKVHTTVSDPLVEEAINQLDPSISVLTDQPAYKELDEKFQEEYLDTVKCRTQIAFALQVAAQTATFGGIGSLITTTDYGTFRVEGSEHQVIDDGFTVRWTVRMKLGIGPAMRKVVDEIYKSEEGMTEEQIKRIEGKRKMAEKIGPPIIAMLKEFRDTIGPDALKEIIANGPRKPLLDDEEIDELDKTDTLKTEMNPDGDGDKYEKELDEQLERDEPLQE